MKDVNSYAILLDEKFINCFYIDLVNFQLQIEEKIPSESYSGVYV